MTVEEPGRKCGIPDLFGGPGPLSTKRRGRYNYPIADDRHAKIIDAIREIPEGFVRTYGDVSPGAPRLSARLLSTQQHPGDLPWWRVVRADGTLAVGEEQRRRLWAEGVPFKGDRVDLDLARIPHEP